jgi:hypothetical protein
VFEVTEVHQRQGGVDVRKRLIQVLTILALVLGLVFGPGLARKVAPPAQLAKPFTPLALDGGGSNG